ncbi:MAG: CaiB/BaiF CoA-transferase family protein [Pseudomonadota bacterium]
MNKSPLDGVRVLDLTRLLPGPVCSLHLADLGADVIKIEDTGSGDYMPAAARAIINRNKRGLRLDLKNADGRKAFLALAATADVVMESFRPGVMERLGVGYANLARLNPRIVYCRITGYGQDGPFRDLAGHDLNYCGYAGVADQMGADAATPALSNLPVADLLGGSLTAAMGILAALFDAARSGQGREVDIALADSVLAHAVMPLATLATEGRTRPAGTDTLTGGLPCYAQYATADGRFLAVGALERKFWDAFCTTLGRPDLQELHRTRDIDKSEWVRGEVARIIGAQTLGYWTEKFSATDCCVSPVLKLEEALQLEQFRARGMVHETSHPVYGAVTQAACPVKMSGYEFSIRLPAPQPGEHSDPILRDAGFSSVEIEALRASGAVK